MAEAHKMAESMQAEAGAAQHEVREAKIRVEEEAYGYAI